MSALSRRVHCTCGCWHLAGWPSHCCSSRLQHTWSPGGTAHCRRNCAAGSVWCCIFVALRHAHSGSAVQIAVYARACMSSTQQSRSACVRQTTPLCVSNESVQAVSRSPLITAFLADSDARSPVRRALCGSCSAVSGNIPEEPVVTSDGHVFEKRLVLKHLEVRSRASPICSAAALRTSSSVTAAPHTCRIFAGVFCRHRHCSERRVVVKGYFHLRRRPEGIR